MLPLHTTGRLYTLDYLRGLAAFSIMLYHYLSWETGAFEAETLLGRMGVYGVSVFYVLSGLTLYHVYKAKMKPTTGELLLFVRKRFFRIYPLLGLATLATVLLSDQYLEVDKLLLNLSGLFGLLAWEDYYATGAWSIGNELVFYLFFPLFMLLFRKSGWALGVFSCLVFALYLYFAFEILTISSPIGQQWHNYVNPLNQLFLFLGGFFLGVFFEKIRFTTSLSVLLLLFGLGIFALHPAAGDKIALVTGTNRLVFTLGSFLICLGFYKISLHLPALLHKPLVFLGEASYSVYLLHPVVYKVLFGATFPLVAGLFLELPVLFRITFSAVLSLLLSYLVYQYFERYFVRLGNRIGNARPSIAVGRNV